MKNVRSRAEHHQPAATNKCIVSPALIVGQLSIEALTIKGAAAGGPTNTTQPNR
jgi:hypothetical protein